MQQPKFTWWPWRILALALPLFAATNTFIAAEQRHTDKQLLQVFFGMMGAGNGFLVASAIGDFGRSILAIPIGAMAALLCASFADVPAFAMLLFLIIGTMAFVYAFSRLQESPIISFFLMGTTTLLGGVVLFGTMRPDNAFVIVVLLSYPFVCAAICASMPLERNVLGMFAAAMTGVIAAFWGVLYGALTLLITIMAGGVLFRSRLAVSLAGLLAISVTNYICIRILFGASVRVGGERESRPPVADGNGVESLPAALIPGPPSPADNSTEPAATQPQAVNTAGPLPNPADFSPPAQEKSAPI